MFVQQPDFSKKFVLNTDVSYFSKMVKKAETNYAALKLELMAIIYGVKAFHYYLYGRKFTVLSDSRPLKYYMLKSHH